MDTLVGLPKISFWEYHQLIQLDDPKKALPDKNR